MEESQMGRLERKSSIESEPRTLNIGQIQFAREAALYVVNTRSIEEALRIFTKGLEPVASGGMKNRDTMMGSSEEMGFLVNGLQTPEFRDIASAPF